MDKGITDMLSFCSHVDFGIVNLSQEEERFRGELNREMLSLCHYLPQSMRTKAALFLMKYFQASLTSGVNFVNYFYAPAWSILYWLLRSCQDNKKLDSEYIQNAKTSHTMAMFLHAFDDHLIDGQLPITHLSLLMRSQSWMIMTQAYKGLATGVDKGAAIVCGFIDDYYSSIGKSDEFESLDSYCALFRKQMATWLITPILLAKMISPNKEFSRSIQAAYSSFGIAWRLLDDLQDIEKDMMNGVHSSIYVCLNEDLKDRWDKVKEKIDQDYDNVKTILSYVLEKGVIDGIKQRVCCELESAASIADSCSMKGLASEFRCLLQPLK